MHFNIGSPCGKHVRLLFGTLAIMVEVLHHATGREGGTGLGFVFQGNLKTSSMVFKGHEIRSVFLPLRSSASEVLRRRTFWIKA